MSYFPYDRDILTSSLWAQGTPEAFKVWSYLLFTADPRTGCVEDADPAIALHCGLTLEATTAALEWLMAPDQHSRTKDHDGRRIARLPAGGFVVLNYMSRAAKDYSTPRVQAFRERQAAAARAATRNADETVKRVSETPGTTDTDTDTTDTTECAAAGADRTEATLEEPKPKGTGRRPKGPVPSGEAQATAARLIRAFNVALGRRVTLLPDLVRDVSARLADGYRADQLVALPVLAAAAEMPDDLRRGLKPAWLLRNGAHPHRSADGRVSGAKNWTSDLLSGADRTTLWPRHVAAAEAAGVLDELRRLGCRFAEAES
ncbi:MAG TPA: hypothetical protein VMX54_15645 [Vicinamibacteria bacterium]|nr:hypothetical protein [Vicinamibacteria bacterium]